VAHVTDEAICIRHWDFSETSQTVSLFSRSHGLLRGLAKGSKRVGGRFSGGIDLLTRGQVVAIVKPGRELSTLTDWTLLSTYRSLRTSLGANQSAYYVVDLVQRLVADGDPHPKLYDAVVDSLRALDEGQDCAAVLLAFQWLLLDEAGYKPSLKDPNELDAQDATTLHFAPDGGGLVANGGWKVRRPTVELLRAVAAAMDDSPDDATADVAGSELDAARRAVLQESPEVIARANRLLAAYIRHILGTFPETMRALFADL
jgi:DNA repair protein RecO (recombination protein O)